MRIANNFFAISVLILASYQFLLTSSSPFDILLGIMEKNELKEETIKSSEVVVTKDKDIEEMLKAGLHFGHRKDKKHSRMEPFIYGTRNDISLIDVSQTKEYLQKATEYLKQKKEKGAIILFVGTKITAKEMIKELAEKNGMPYMIERWLGGTLTNFEILSLQIKKLKEMEEGEKKGEFKKYSKKEQLKIKQNLEKLKRKIGGLKTLQKLPDVLFVVDINKEKTAIKEAVKKEIPVVGICDTDGDPNLVDFPIPANDDAPSSLKYILEKVKKALK